MTGSGSISEGSWITYNGHPASGLRYQESTVGFMTAARVLRNDREIVSPDFDVDRVYRQYQGKVNMFIRDNT